MQAIPLEQGTGKSRLGSRAIGKSGPTVLRRIRAALAMRRARKLNSRAENTRDPINRSNLRDGALLSEARARFLSGELSVADYARQVEILTRAIAWRNRRVRHFPLATMTSSSPPARPPGSHAGGAYSDGARP